MGPPSPVLIRWLPAPPLLLLLLCGRGTRPLPSHLPFWQASSIAGPYPCPPLGKHRVIRESCSRRESGLFHTDAACLEISWISASKPNLSRLEPMQWYSICLFSEPDIMYPVMTDSVFLQFTVATLYNFYGAGLCRRFQGIVPRECRHLFYLILLFSRKY